MRILDRLRSFAGRAASLFLLCCIFNNCSVNAKHDFYRHEFADVCKYEGERPDYKKENCQASSIQEYHSTDGKASDYSLGFVEFDDLGLMWNANQKKSLNSYIIEQQKSSNVLMVVFTHGWHHNAKFNDSNVRTFRKVLMKVSENEDSISRVNKVMRRKVIGIYLGWRGEQISIPVLTYFTFWSRKATAERVGHGEATEVLCELEKIKDKGDAIPRPSSFVSFRNSLVVVGHSFGADVVYTALEDVFVSRLSEADNGSAPRHFGNMVVLINPAFEAMRFAKLRDYSFSKKYSHAEDSVGNGKDADSANSVDLPSLVVLGSRGDFPNRVFFHLGRFFATSFENYNTDKYKDERKRNSTSLGSYAPFRSHELYPGHVKESIGVAEKDSSIQGVTRSLTMRGKAPEQEIQFPGVVLKFLGKNVRDVNNPYWSVAVDKAIIRDHNDIGNPLLLGFITQLVSSSTLHAKSKGRKVSVELSNGKTSVLQ